MMNYLLDTCVLSEFARRNPNPKVTRWVERFNEYHLFLSVITIGEIQRGVEKLPASHRKTELLAWVNNGLVERLREQIIPLDTQTMQLWGSLTARMEAMGRPMAVMDSLIAATALKNSLVLVTHNETDYSACGVQIINPWK